MGNISQKDGPHMAVRVGGAMVMGAVRLENVVLHGDTVGRKEMNEYIHEDSFQMCEYKNRR